MVVATSAPAEDLTLDRSNAVVEELRRLCRLARDKGTLGPTDAAHRTALMRQLLDHNWTVPRLAAALGRSEARLYVLLKPRD